MGDHRSPFRRDVATRSGAVGIAYTGAFLLWIATGIAAVVLLPVVGLVCYYLGSGHAVAVWRCPECGGADLSRYCRQCGRDRRLDGLLEQAAVFAVIVPAGAILTEFVAVLVVEGAFTAFGSVPDVAWFEQQWYGTVGLFGWMGLFLFTMSASGAYLLSLGLGAVWAGSRRLWRTVA